MILFGLALGALELFIVAAFIIALIVAVSFDRAGKESPKWYVLGVGAAILAFHYWSSFTFSGLWSEVTTFAFWKPVVVYGVVGLLYSALEFMLIVRKSARSFKDVWDKHLDTDTSFKKVEKATTDNPDEPHNILGSVRIVETKIARTAADMYAEVREQGAVSGLFNEVLKMTERFVTQHTSKNTIITVKQGDDKISVEPHINRVVLAEHIGVWTFFWPFYALSLILGDLLTEVFRVIADFFVHMSGRFVKLNFKNVFKF